MKAISSPAPITFGRRLMEVEVAGVIITETAHEAHYRLEFHEHEYPSVTFVISGFHVEKFRFREVICAPGNLLVKPGGALHANQYGPAGSHSIILAFRRPNGVLLKAWSRSLLDVHFQQGGLATAYAWRAASEAREQSAGWKLRVEELLTLLAAEIALRKQVEETQNPSWLPNVRDFLESNYDGDLTLGDIAAVAGVHPVYLTRAFRARFGCTVAQFVRRKRLDRAVRELTSTDKSIAQIAVESGFFDQSHLVNILRTTAGITPAALRRTFPD